MTFIEALANYLCDQSTGTTYTDGRGVSHTTIKLGLGRSCFVHEGPGDIEHTDMVVLALGDATNLPADDPRTIRTIRFAVHALDYFAATARIEEIRGIFTKLLRFYAPSSVTQTYHARVEMHAEPSPEGRDDFNRCISILPITFQHVTL